jgi:hypothetical protein
VYIVLGVDIPDIYRKNVTMVKMVVTKKISRPMYQKNMVLQQNHHNFF